MIAYHNRGRAKRPSYDEIAGRICLVQDFTEWGGVKGPVRVTSDDGRAVIGNELVRSWDDAERRWKYTDESDTRSDVRIDKSAIRASCDTAAEAVALMEVSAAAQKAIIHARKLAEARMKALGGASIATASDIRLLSFDEHDEWVNPDSGETLLSVPLGEEFR
jgi:hypothetical protein